MANWTDNPADVATFAALVLTVAFDLRGVARSAYRARRASRRAAAYHRANADADGFAAHLLPAGDVVLEGKVAYAEGAKNAMRVDFEQEGAERENSGSWTHSWTEIHRKLTVEPFYLVRDVQNAQARIRVEPMPLASQLFDQLEDKILVNQTATAPHRYRSALLVPDETVWVVGRLSEEHDPAADAAATKEAGYRVNALPTRWVIRGAPTLLVSSLPLVAHFTERARLHVRHAVAIALVTVLPFVIVERYVARAHGAATVGSVVDVRSETDDDGKIIGYQATVDVGGKMYTSERLPVSPAVGSPFTLRVGQGITGGSENDGADVTFESGERFLAFALLVLSGALRIGLAVYSRQRLPWFRSATGLNENGAGRLFPETEITK